MGPAEETAPLRTREKNIRSPINADNKEMLIGVHRRPVVIFARVNGFLRSHPYFSVRTKATTSAACFSVTPETGFIFPCPLRMTCCNWASVLACTSLEASGACVTLYILAMAALPSPFGPWQAAHFAV